MKVQVWEPLPGEQSGSRSGGKGGSAWAQAGEAVGGAEEPSLRGGDRLLCLSIRGQPSRHQCVDVSVARTAAEVTPWSRRSQGGGHTERVRLPGIRSGSSGADRPPAPCAW